MNKRNIAFWIYIFVIVSVCASLICVPYISESEIIVPNENETVQADKLVVEDVKTPQTQNFTSKKYIGEFTIYAYCPCKKCCDKDNGITKSETIATEGRTIAANMPFGTKVYIDGIGERIVEDRGGNIGKGEIDLFMSEHKKALDFGVRRLKVWKIN